MKSPYKFPARSRAAMIDAMESIGGYSSGYHSRYAFAWNAKLYNWPDSSKLEAVESDTPFNRAWDSAFAAEMQSEGFFENIVESMRWQVESYSDYDGNESFDFDFTGRSGGYIALSKAFGWDVGQLDLDEVRGDFTGWPFERVRLLYRAVTVMDSDFTRAKIDAELAYRIAWEREQWEESRRDEIAAKSEIISANKAEARALQIERHAAQGLSAGIESATRLRIADLIRDSRRALAERRALCEPDRESE